MTIFSLDADLVTDAVRAVTGPSRLTDSPANAAASAITTATPTATATSAASAAATADAAASAAPGATATATSTLTSTLTAAAASASGSSTDGDLPAGQAAGAVAREGFDVSDSQASVAERFARATWSGIAEPGDVVAGALVRSLGASEALLSLVERRKPNDILRALREAACDEVSLGEIVTAVERWMPRLTPNSALASLTLAARCRARLLIPSDDDWPASLRDLGPHEPLALWVRGRMDAVRSLQKSIALVGARAATGYGEHMAMELAAGLSDSRWAVVSGAAYGIDGMAHRTTLASAGSTVAFLAGGVDRFYPSGHDSLLSRIVEEGAVISEMPCGSPPTKWRFLQRNRLIAASSRATVVIEAGHRSGSLNTAAHAASLGRPLGAVPGPVTSLSSAGCHRLLREYDATCVTNAAEIVELAGGAPAVDQRAGRAGFASAEQMRVLDAISNRTYRSADEIARRSGLGVSATQALLGVLGLEGVLTESELGWRLARPAN